ncbi:gustatory receptor 23a isoform X1 [Monomorium pharaonis]|uniref:gustatory receptor 23a isoform X1 n=1 Tax=Monomorium pharaonis TaxID=307658 RepID=UPI0017468A3A|nr:gustatory receptor 23a isoform X1 [Monomorium pharaonis]
MFRTRKGRRWRLFNATDFQSLMYPNFILSKILGIFPYKIKISIFEASKPHYILWTIVFCAVCVHQLTLLYKLNFSGRIKIDVPKTITLNFSFIYGLFITVATYISSGSRMRLLQTISDISSKLPQQYYQKISKLIHAKDIFGFFFVLCMGITYMKNSDMIFGIPLEMLRGYTTFLAFQMDMLYVNCVCVLKACFKEINNNLKNLLVMNNIPSLYHQQRYPFLLKKLKSLKKQYLVISDTVQMLNVIFSPQLLAIIILSLKKIIFHVYFYVVQWQGRLTFNLDNIYNTYFIMIILYNFIRITLIVWVCETGKNQAIKIRTTIHDVLNSTNDVQIKNELHLFSLQIFHCKNIFSAKGFAVDATLITTMASIVITYLLILIQFLIISHSCDEKNTIHYTQFN